MPRHDGIDTYEPGEVRHPNQLPNPEWDDVILGDYSHKKIVEPEMERPKRTRETQAEMPPCGKWIDPSSSTYLLDLASAGKSTDMRVAKRHHANRYEHLRNG